MADIDRILLQMEQRGHEYFDETMRIGRVMDLLNRSRMQEGFERQVVADAPQQIETENRGAGRLAGGRWTCASGRPSRPPRRAPPPVPRAHRRRRRRAVSLRSDAPDRRGRRRCAAGRRLLRSPARSAGARRRRQQRGGRCRRGRGRRGRLRRARRGHRDHRSGGFHRLDHGLAPRHARVLHHPGEAQAGEGRDADEGRRRSASDCRRHCASSSGGKWRRAAIASARASRPTAGSCAPRATASRPFEKELTDATAALTGLRSRIERATAPSAASSTGTPIAR